MTSPPEEYRAVVEHARDGVLVVDGTVEYANPAAGHLFGTDPGRLAGRDPASLVHPDDRAALTDALSGSDVTEVRVRVRAGDGRWRPVSVVVSDATDRIGGMVCNVADPSAPASTDGRDADGTDVPDPDGDGDALLDDRREMRNDLETLRELYAITSSTTLAPDEKRSRVLELGVDRLEMPYGFVTRIEDGTQVIVDAVGDHDGLSPGASCPLEEAYCRKTVAEGGLVTVEDVVGEGWVDDRAYQRFGLGSYVGATVSLDGTVYGTLCFSSDDARDRPFTEGERTFVQMAARWLGYELDHQRHEAELRRETERLDRFASAVAHDLRNPLTGAQASLELARRTGDQDHLDDAEEAIDRAFDMVDEVLAFARDGQNDLDFEPIPLASLATEVGSTVGVDLELADPPTVVGDYGRLRRLLENLLRNAVDHAGPDPHVRVGALDDREGFYVEDDGPGIDPELGEEVFERGVTTGDGTGLGLATVREIAVAHGWTVAVAESAEDRGARFEFDVVPGESATDSAGDASDLFPGIGDRDPVDAAPDVDD